MCIYPCHGILEGNKLYTRIGEPNHFDPNLYKFEISPPSSIFIYGDPCIQDDGCLGHLINDPFPDISKFKKNIGKEMLEYMLRTNILKNCAFIQRSHYVYIKTTN